MKIKLQINGESLFLNDVVEMYDPEFEITINDIDQKELRKLEKMLQYVNENAEDVLFNYTTQTI